MIDTPKILQIASQPTAAIRLDVLRTDMMKVFGPAAQELYSTLGALGVKPTGALFDYHPTMPPDRFVFELSVNVANPITPSGRVVNSATPAGTVARTIYHGPYEGLPEAWGEFEAWIAAQGKKSGPWILQAYVKGPADSADPSTWETELTRVLAD
jgi:effector-binding domain-containing protein